MSGNFRPRIALTSGEPAGIGPELCAMLEDYDPGADITMIGDRDMLLARAEQLGLSLQKQHIHHIPLTHPSQPGVLNPANGPYVLQTLDHAIQGCMGGAYDALVTAPVHKGVINDAGIPFTGHTEYLAEKSHTPHVVMMLVGGGMRVALVTIHMALREVPQAITSELLQKTIRVLHHDLQHRFGIANPHIMVAGLNPHAGENGYLGREEIEVITPMLEVFRRQGINTSGPYPADTMFSRENLKKTDCFLAMYHDQGLAVLKHASFGEGVNVTLGLPFIRTSVDHGTALDLAGTGTANPGSLKTAIALAVEVAKIRS